MYWYLSLGQLFRTFMHNLKQKKQPKFGKLSIGLLKNLSVFSKTLKTTQLFLNSQQTLRKIAVWTGLEPATPCVTGRYSNQLNYQTVAL